VLKKISYLHFNNLKVTSDRLELTAKGYDQLTFFDKGTNPMLSLWLYCTAFKVNSLRIVYNYDLLIKHIFKKSTTFILSNLPFKCPKWPLRLIRNIYLSTF